MNLRAAAIVLLCTLGLAFAANANAAPPPLPHLCDASAEDCRQIVLDMIAAEKVGIDVSFWFMDDQRYSAALVKRWQAGVPVRVIMDPRANTSKPANATVLSQLQTAGIPMRKKSSGDIAHWKGMIFAGQNIAEFSGANYSPYEYVPQVPYVNYNDEAIYFSNEADVVHSLMQHFDDVWTDYNGYADYANVVDPTTRTYPTYPVAPEFNFPPVDSYFNRLHPLMQAEAAKGPNGKIDVTMYRITDSRDADDMIAAVKAGVPVRLYTDTYEYRNPARIDHSYNVDRMYIAGVQVRMRAHLGLNHQKTVLLYSQGITVFGTSNWSTASDDNQLEVNYFTTKPWFFQWFQDLFERKWNNSHVMPDGTMAQETEPFVPLPPDKPTYTAPANLATGVNPNSTVLTWAAGNWARQYDIYFGTTASPPLIKTNVNLGPGNKSYALPVLQAGTTYYWKIVSKTMANLTASGPVWSFTTAGTPPSTPPGIPASPAPGNAATGVSLNPTLTWTDTGATSYDVKFGAANPPAQVATALTSASYTPPSLTGNTTYYWQIVANNAAGSTAGPVWSFTTTAPPVPLPSPWSDGDIGSVGVKGSATLSNGKFTVSGGGADIWNSADAFHFAYQPLNGDGELVARVTSVPNTYAWAKAGVMIRDTLASNSSYALMLVSAAKGTAFQYRATTGAAAAGTNTGATAAPYWVKITRSGATLSGYQSPDGASWTLVGTASVTMGSSVFIGLAVTSHNTSQLCAATFDNVTVSGAGAPPPPSPPTAPATPTPGDASQNVPTSQALSWTSTGATTYDINFGTTTPPSQAATGLTAASYAPTLAPSTTYFWQVTANNSGGSTTGPVWTFTTAAAPPPQGLPSGWTDGDIGAVGIAGSASYSSGTFTVSGAGADIWNAADAFHYAYEPLTGDGQLIARVATVQNVYQWTKAGVMIRDTLNPNSAYALMLISAAKGSAFQYRTSAGAAALNVAGPATTVAPQWVKIVRSGNTLSGYQSPDGTTWTLIGSATIPMGSTINIGLAVTSHNVSKAATATFDNVQ